MQLTPSQRAALNSVAVNRAYMKKTGLTYSGQRVWTSVEDEVLRLHFPNVEELRQSVPWRTDGAIRKRAQHLHLVRPRRVWTDPEFRAMKPPYIAGAPVAEILPRLHSKTKRQVWRKASGRRLRRPRKPPKETGMALVDAVRRRAFDLRITMADLDEYTDSNGYFSSPRCVRWGPLRRAIRLLGGQISVRWRDRDQATR